MGDYIRMTSTAKPPDILKPLPTVQKEILDWHERLKKNCMAVSDRGDEKEVQWLDWVPNADASAPNPHFDNVPKECVRMNRMLIAVFEKEFKAHSGILKIRLERYE